VTDYLIEFDNDIYRFQAFQRIQGRLKLDDGMMMACLRSFSSDLYRFDIVIKLEGLDFDYLDDLMAVFRDDVFKSKLLIEVNVRFSFQELKILLSHVRDSYYRRETIDKLYSSGKLDKERCEYNSLLKKEDIFPVINRMGSDISRIMTLSEPEKTKVTNEKLKNDVPIKTDVDPCAVCLEYKPNWALIGCGHVYCGPCVREIKICPQCRKPITELLRLY
jgi:hypothetical protein